MDEQYEIFRNAVQALDAGDIERLEKLLDEHPWLVRYRCHTQASCTRKDILPKSR